MRWPLGILIFLTAVPACAQSGGSDLKLLLSIDRTTIAAPYSVQAVLHFHNAGKQTLLLYTPVRDPSAYSPNVNPFLTEEPGPGSTSGGPELTVHLAPSSGAAPATPGGGRVFEGAGFPHPQLVALAPGGDYEEKTALRLDPASGNEDTPQSVWGPYKLSATYSASFSNADNLNRILDTAIWQGESGSNTIQIELKPPPWGPEGSISGSVVGSDAQPILSAIVTLTNQQEQAVAQTAPDQNGKFTFAHLPFGFYWVTARGRNASEDRTVFRHVDLSSGDPFQTVQLVMLKPEIYRGQQLLHKPVIIRIFDSNDQPLNDITLEATWSSGTVLDSSKGRTADDGTALFEMIPGRNYLSLKRKGCPKQDERIDVSPGGGIDGFKLVFTCTKR